GRRPPERIAGRVVRSGTVTVPQLHERDQTRNDGYPVGAPANPPRGLSIELRVPFQRPEYAERTNHPGWPLVWWSRHLWRHATPGGDLVCCQREDVGRCLLAQGLVRSPCSRRPPSVSRR